MFEVIPSGVRLDEAAREVDAGMVIDGEQEGLLGGGRGGHEMGVVGLDVGLHRGASPDHAAEPLQLIGDELIAGRILQRQELQEEAMSLGRPVLAPVAAAGLRCEAGALAEQSSPQLVEPGAAHPQMRGGSGGVVRPRVAVVEYAADQSDGMAEGELLVFLAGTL